MDGGNVKVRISVVGEVRGWIGGGGVGVMCLMKPRVKSRIGLRDSMIGPWVLWNISIVLPVKLFPNPGNPSPLGSERQTAGKTYSLFR